jgi:small GTP-binding protein
MAEIKIVFLGESTVGKTSIISCLTHSDFISEVSPTIGASFTLHPMTVEGVQVKLKIWDTAGQEKFRALVPMYFRDTQVAMLVFALDCHESFSALGGWVEDVRRNSKDPPSLIVVGNKSDLERVVLGAEGEAFAENVGATYMECSAKTKTGIPELFTAAAEMGADLKSRPKSEPEPEPVAIPVEPEAQPGPAKSCC